MKKLLEKDSFILIIVLILCLPALWALLIPGFYGASDEIHIAWLDQMDKTLNWGQFPPRFVPDLSYRFGYPLFNFVYPLPFYIGEIFHKLGLGFVDSIKATFFISIPISAMGMYFLLKQFTNKFSSLVGSMLYIFAPYRSVDLYVRGAIGEIIAFIFFPFVALAIVKITSQNLEKQSWRWVSLGGLSLAGLVLSHNIATYMFLPFVLLLGFLRIFFLSSKKIEALKNLGLVLVFGLLLSVYFWLPALMDSSLMKYDTVFNFIDHFPTLKQLVTPYWGYGASVPGPYDGISFFLGVSSLLLILLTLIFSIINKFKFTKEIKVLLIWSVLSLGIVVFMMNFRSSFLWSHLPLLPYFQFPWRFLMMTTFLIPFLITSFNKFKYANYLAFLILLLTLAINFSYFRPQDFLGRRDDYFLNRYIPNPVVSPEYQLTQEEYLRLPNNTSQRPDRVYPLLYSDHALNILSQNINNEFQAQFNVQLTQPTLVHFSKYLFPGWAVKIDNQDTKIKPGEKFGDITFLAPPGNHKIKVFFQETSFKCVLDVISTICLIILLILMFKPNLLGKKTNE